MQIVVQGAAEVTAAPDMVKVTANAGVSGKTIAEAQAGMNKIIDAVTRKLLELGVADDDIVTTSYAYYTTYDYSGESPVMNGYQANHTLGITCRDVDMLDSVVGVLVDCGMSEIYGIEYDSFDPQRAVPAGAEAGHRNRGEEGRRDGEGRGADD